jgi:very-short-patch-repair endonuclease
MAAALACGDDSWVGHRAAGGVYEIRRWNGGDVDVTVVGGGRPHRPGIRMHRSICLAPQDVGVYHGIPITSPARTLLDLATVLSRNDLAWAYNEALIQELTTPEHVKDVLRRTHGHPGSRLLKALLERDAPPHEIERKLARLVLEALRRGRVPEPQTEHRIGEWSVDFYWPEYRLVLEADGFKFHKGPEAWRRDRRKQADLEAQGLLVLRTEWEEVSERPESMVARVVRAQLERSGSASPATSAATAPAARNATRTSTV